MPNPEGHCLSEAQLELPGQAALEQAAFKHKHIEVHFPVQVFYQSGFGLQRTAVGMRNFTQHHYINPLQVVFQEIKVPGVGIRRVKGFQPDAIFR